MDKENWILCPVCGNKTRLKIRKDTERYGTQKLPAILSEM